MENNTELPTIQGGDVEIVGNIGELAGALAIVQGELKAVSKDEAGYGYSYASLASTIEVSSTILSKNGLSVSQLVGSSANDPKVTTILMHSSGAYIKSAATIAKIDMKSCNSAQEFGASLSYLRRYALQAILNMASEDVDASSQGKATPAKSFKKTTKVVVKADAPAKQSFRKAKKDTTTEAPNGSDF